MPEDPWCLGDHDCVAYAADEECRDTLLAFVRHGVGAGRRVVVFLDTDQVDLARSLTAAVPDAVPGQFAVLRYGTDFGADPGDGGGPYDTESMLVGMSTLLDETFGAGHKALSVAGQMTWLPRTGVSHAQLVEYETQVNRFFSDRRVAAMCLYDRRLFPRTALTELGVVHPGPLLRFTLARGGGGLRLTGEVDASNGRSLAAILAMIPERPDLDPTVVVDASELRFVDAAGARTIMRFAEARQRTTGRHTVVRCTRTVRQALRLVGADGVAGLLLSDAAL